MPSLFSKQYNPSFLINVVHLLPVSGEYLIEKKSTLESFFLRQDGDRGPIIIPYSITLAVVSGVRMCRLYRNVADARCQSF